MDFKQYVEFANNITGCARSVLDEAIERISVLDFENTQFSVKIPPSVSSLIECSLNQHFDEDDRAALWEVLYAVLHDVYKREDYDIKINDAISKIFPKTELESEFITDGIDFFLNQGIEWGGDISIETEEIDQNTGEISKVTKNFTGVNPDDGDEAHYLSVEISVVKTIIR